MSKKLTPLEAFNNILKMSMGLYKEDIEAVETALKDSEMEHTLRVRLENINYELVREKQENEKKLKALEIIKDNLNVDEILFSAKGVCNSKDYDLLKEVLK